MGSDIITSIRSDQTTYGGDNLSPDKLLQQTFRAVRGKNKLGENTVLLLPFNGILTPIHIPQNTTVYTLIKQILGRDGHGFTKSESERLLKDATAYDYFGKHLERNFNRPGNLPKTRHTIMRMLNEKPTNS